MDTIIQYVANDGTIFDDEDECLTYESKIQMEAIKDDVILLDSCGDKLPLSYDGFTNASFLICKTDDAAYTFYELFHHSFDTPWSSSGNVAVGAWEYTEEQEWMDIKSFLMKADKVKKILEDAEVL